MSKYYRVRNQQEWNWLAKELELWGVRFIYKFKFPAIIQYEQSNDCSSYRIVKEHNGPEPVVEVSDLMEGEKIEKEKEPITTTMLDQKYLTPFSHEIEFTQAEKAEFDKLDKIDTLHDVLEDIQSGVYNNLRRRLYNHCDDTFVKEQEAEFARAWADPSLIEAIPEKKWNVLVPRTNNLSYFKINEDQINWGFKDRNNRDDHQFTAEELKHYGLDNDLFEKVEVSE